MYILHNYVAELTHVRTYFCFEMKLRFSFYVYVYTNVELLNSGILVLVLRFVISTSKVALTVKYKIKNIQYEILKNYDE